MEHVKLQIGCLVVLFYLAFIYIREARIYGQKLSKTLFDELLIFGIISVVFDGVTAYLVNQPQWIDTVLNRVMHLFFLIALDSQIFALCLYMIWVTGAYPRRKRGQWILYTPFVINIILVIANIGNLEYHRGVYTNYSMGWSAYTCFAMVAFYLIFTLVVFFRRWRHIETHKRSSIFTFLLVLSAVSAVQMIYPEVLLTSLGITVMILGVYLNLEDPALRKLGRYHSDMVVAFADIIENRDDSTGGHIRRTSKYVEMIAQEFLNSGMYADILTKDYINNLVKAAPMHDIGKVSVPDAILQKPGKLTDEEYEIMKKHSQSGAEIIRKAFRKLGNEEYRTMACLVALHHHERWDGKGYPFGLAGEDIPLCARIMAVADVFDAVSAKRCYRDAMPLDKCFAIIEEGIGTQFDPTVAKLFLSMRAEVEEIYKEMQHED